MSFKKEELKLLKYLLQREIKHFKKDKKQILFEGIRAVVKEAKAKKFMTDLLKKINKQLR